MEIKINLDDDLPLAKMLNMHDVVTFFKSFNENYNHYYYLCF